VNDWNKENEDELALNLIQDESANRALQGNELDRLREENARLRREIEQLRG
jgi:hypothetical protein